MPTIIHYNSDAERRASIESQTSGKKKSASAAPSNETVANSSGYCEYIDPVYVRYADNIFTPIYDCTPGESVWIQVLPQPNHDIRIEVYTAGNKANWIMAVDRFLKSMRLWLERQNAYEEQVRLKCEFVQRKICLICFLLERLSDKFVAALSYLANVFLSFVSSIIGVVFRINIWCRHFFVDKRNLQWRYTLELHRTHNSHNGINVYEYDPVNPMTGENYDILEQGRIPLCIYHLIKKTVSQT